MALRKLVEAFNLSEQAIKELINKIKSSEDKLLSINLSEIGDEWYVEMYSYGLKVGGPNDDDSNDPYEFDRIADRFEANVKKFYPEMVGKLEYANNSEKGYWTIIIQVPRASRKESFEDQGSMTVDAVVGLHLVSNKGSKTIENELREFLSQNGYDIKTITVDTY